MLPASMTTGYQGRLLALLLLLVVLGGVYLVVATPLLELYAGRAAVLENRRMLVPRLKAAADELPELRKRVAELRATAGARKVTLEGLERCDCLGQPAKPHRRARDLRRCDDRQHRKPAGGGARWLPRHRPALYAQRPV